jgi:ketol-acid reductoisomerase
MTTVDTNIIGKSFSEANGVDNIELIAINDAIRNHPIEAVGKRLRAAMTAMKIIKSDVKTEDSVLA